MCFGASNKVGVHASPGVGCTGHAQWVIGYNGILNARHRRGFAFPGFEFYLNNIFAFPPGLIEVSLVTSQSYLFVDKVNTKT